MSKVSAKKLPDRIAIKGLHQTNEFAHDEELQQEMLAHNEEEKVPIQ